MVDEASPTFSAAAAAKETIIGPGTSLKDTCQNFTDIGSFLQLRIVSARQVHHVGLFPKPRLALTFSFAVRSSSPRGIESNQQTHSAIPNLIMPLLNVCGWNNQGAIVKFQIANQTCQVLEKNSCKGPSEESDMIAPATHAISIAGLM